jgi:hypothetical protein
MAAFRSDVQPCQDDKPDEGEAGQSHHPVDGVRHEPEAAKEDHGHHQPSVVAHTMWNATSVSDKANRSQPPTDVQGGAGGCHQSYARS